MRRILKASRLISIVLFFLMFVACVPTPTATPVPTLTALPPATAFPSATATETPPPLPTATATSTATLIPTATPTNIPTPTATPLPQAQLKTTSDLYSGPDVYGYDTIAQLAKGAKVTLLGVYGDFVQVKSEISGTVKSGFIPAVLLDNIPSGLSQLPSDGIPLEVVGNYFTTDKLGIFENTTSGYKQEPIGSVSPKGELRIDSNLSVDDKNSAREASNGLVLDNGQVNNSKLRRLYVIHQSGRWSLLYQTFDFCCRNLWSSGSANLTGKFSLSISKDGKTATITWQNSKPVSVAIPDPLYGEGNEMSVRIQTASGSKVSVSQLNVFSPPDGKYITSILSPDAITIDTVDRLTELRTIPVPGSVFSLAISPDGKLLSLGRCGRGGWLFICETADADVRIISTETGQQIQRLEVSQTVPMSVAFSPDGKVLGASFPDEVRLWDTKSWQLVGRLEASGVRILNFSFSPDGKQIATSWFRSVLWDVASRKQMPDLPLQHGATFSPTGYILAGQDEKGVVIWNFGSGTEVRRINLSPAESNWVAFSPNGNLLATSECVPSPDKQAPFCKFGTYYVRLWNANSGNEIIKFGENSTGQLLAFSPDGTLLVGTGYDISTQTYELILWDVKTGREVRRLPNLGGFVAFSPDGRLLVSYNYKQSALRVFGLR